MRYLVALLLPWVAFLTVGKPISAIVCLILQCTVLAWPLAAIWAMLGVHEYRERRRLDRAVERLEARAAGHATSQPTTFTPATYAHVTAIAVAGLLLAVVLVLPIR